MTVARFEGTDPVARYWLAHCTGFAVEGAARGVVEELLRDADPHVTTRLVVRTRGGRRTIVPAASIAAVVPAERTLVVERGRRERAEWARLRAAGVRVAAASGSGARIAVATAAAAGPPARGAALAAGRRLAELAAPVAAVVAHSLGALGGELHATAAMVLRSLRKRWTIVRSWR